MNSMSIRTPVVCSLLAGLIMGACTSKGGAGEEGSGKADSSTAVITEQDIEIVKNAIRTIQLDADGQFNKNEVIDATIEQMKKESGAPGPSERAFVDDLISALDKNGPTDTALVIDAEEVEEITDDHWQLLERCEGPMYAAVFWALEKSELGAAKLDEAGLEAWTSFDDGWCDE
jgi:hypothetical protein